MVGITQRTIFLLRFSPQKQAAMIRKEDRSCEKLYGLLGSTAGPVGHSVSLDGKRQFSRPASPDGTALESGHCPDPPIFRIETSGRARESCTATPLRARHLLLHWNFWPGRLHRSRRNSAV